MVGNRAEYKADRDHSLLEYHHKDTRKTRPNDRMILTAGRITTSNRHRYRTKSGRDAPSEEKLTPDLSRYLLLQTCKK